MIEVLEEKMSQHVVVIYGTKTFSASSKESADAILRNCVKWNADRAKRETAKAQKADAKPAPAPAPKPQQPTRKKNTNKGGGNKSLWDQGTQYIKR